MNAIRFIEPVTVNFKKSAGQNTMTFEAHRDYVISHPQTQRIMKEPEVQKRVYKLSCVDNRIENFNVKCVPAGAKVLVYNGSGGYGDQIITWPFAKYLHDMGYKVHVATEPGNTTCWWNFEWVEALHVVPFQMSLFKMFDHIISFEHVVNMDEHKDQEHPLDIMFRKVGIDPESVPKEKKRVVPNFTQSELTAMNRYPRGQKVGIYQLSCATKTRSLTPSNSAFMLRQLASKFPDWHWLALYDEYVNPEYTDAVKCPSCKGTGEVYVQAEKEKVDRLHAAKSEALVAEGKEVEPPNYDDVPKEPCTACAENQWKTFAPNAELYTAHHLRELWSLTQRAEVVVAPDSMMVHLCGSLGVPCVGLWGLTDPSKRVSYYVNHFPVWHQSACSQSPCFAYSADFPRYCPGIPGVQRKECECLGAIQPSGVVEIIKQIMTMKEEMKRRADAESTYEVPSHA